MASSWSSRAAATSIFLATAADGFGLNLGQLFSISALVIVSCTREALEGDCTPIIESGEGGEYALTG